MNNKLFRNVLVVGIIFLFFGIAFQPITSIEIEQFSNSKQVEKLKILNDDAAKKYLFETIIQIANNHDIKNFLDQSEDKIVLSDFDYKDLINTLLVKNPILVFSILLTRSSMTYDSLNKIYNKGAEIVNMLGEDKTIDIIRSSNFINKEIVNELIYETKDNEEISSLISELERLNNKFKKDTPFENYPLICSFLVILDILFISLLALTLIFILMMPGKLLWNYITALIPIFGFQLFIVTYIISILQCIEIP